MTDALEIATEGLYQTFSKYHLPSSMSGCPCCVSETDISTLHSKPLRLLNGEDISRYAWKAMTTWGSVDDFRYYLPRLLELASTGGWDIDNFVILEKLSYGNWKSWAISEQENISLFLKSWWEYEINYIPYFNPDLLLDLLVHINDLEWMLGCWKLESDSLGFRNFINLIEDNYWDLNQENRKFKILTRPQLNSFLEWINTKSTLLEEAFFEFEKTDDALSARISNCLNMIDSKI